MIHWRVRGVEAVQESGVRQRCDRNSSSSGSSDLRGCVRGEGTDRRGGARGSLVTST